MVLKIEDAETGNVFYIHEEASIEKVKFELSLHQPISPQDQILLFGPPFKVLDIHYNSGLDLTGKRIFLYDKKLVFDVNIIARRMPLPNCDQILFDAEKDTVWRGASNIEDLQNLLNRTKLYEMFITESLSTFRKCGNQVQIQYDAMEAAIENMKLIFEVSSNHFQLLQVDFDKLRVAHESLFKSFESSLENLQKVDLSLEIIEEFKAKGISDIPQTLLDCIPVERERVYFKQCKETHDKVVENYERSVMFYQSLVEKVTILSRPRERRNAVNEIIMTAEKFFKDQSDDMGFLRDSYQLMYNSSRQILDPQKVHMEEPNMEEERKVFADETFLLRMKNRCAMIKELKFKLEEERDQTTKTLMEVLRHIATVQTDIQYKLKKEMEWIKKWVNAGGDGYFRHLCQVSELPLHYEQLLSEIHRRNRYNLLLSSKINDFRSKLELLRKEEITERETFMKSHGINLPPIFLSTLPTLRDKPPAITLDIMLESLPKVQVDVSSELNEKNDTDKSVMVGNSFFQQTTEIDITRKSGNYSSHENAELLYQILKELKTIRKDVDNLDNDDDADVEKDIFTNLRAISALSEQRSKYPVITFMDFQVGDVALFMPAFVNNRKIWMAFNSGFPYRFLAEESLGVFLKKSRGKEPRASIIGKITKIETRIAETEASDFNIPQGTEYYLCHAVPLYRQKVLSQTGKREVDGRMESEEVSKFERGKGDSMEPENS